MPEAFTNPFARAARAWGNSSAGAAFGGGSGGSGGANGIALKLTDADAIAKALQMLGDGASRGELVKEWGDVVQDGKDKTVASSGSIVPDAAGNNGWGVEIKPKGFFGKLWGGIKKGASDAWGGVKNGVSNAFGWGLDKGIKATRNAASSILLAGSGIVMPIINQAHVIAKEGIHEGGGI